VTSGSRLGNYEILEPLGQGGMGAVYRARDSRLRRDVALKVVHAHLLDADHLDRFRREARALAALGHPNVANVHELGEVDGTTFIVMELVPGETLAGRIAAGRLAVSEVLRVALQVAAALEAVHDRGIIHRDLKPANIKLTSEGVVKVLDFGLAKETPDADHAGTAVTATVVTREGVIAGTAAYMSPEQTRGHVVDRRTDIWAFGCVVYEMLTGRPAFAAVTTADVIAAVIEREVDWRAIPANAPPAVERVLRRCLQRDVKQRLRDIGDARLELEDAMTFPHASDTVRVRGRTRALAIIGLLAAGAMAGALAALAMREPPDDATPPARFIVPVSPAAPLGGLDFPSVVLSPDGRRLVYVASRGGRTQLFLRPLDGIEAAPIAGTANAAGPFFSPDSQWIAFFADGQLKKVPVAGGTPVTLCEAPVGLGGSWSADDVIVFAAATGSGLSQVSAAGGTPQRLTMLDVAQGEFSHRWPEWLPDGETVLFTIGTSGSWSDAQIVAQSVASGRRSILVRGGTNPHYLPTGSLIYAQNGRIMRVPFNTTDLTVGGSPIAVLDNVLQSADGAAQLSVTPSGNAVFVTGALDADQRRLVSVGRDGVSAPFAAPPGSYESPRASPDGRRLLVGVDVPTQDLWVYDMMSGGTEQLTFGAGAASPVWARDGQQAAFTSTRAGVPNLFITRVGQSGASERVAASENQQIPGSWAPDGTLAYTERRATTGRDILLLSLRDQTQRALLTSPADESSPKFSPDGLRIAYVSNETGSFEVYVRPLSASGRGRPVSVGGGSEPVWASNGRELFYREGTRMMAVPLDPGGKVQPPRVLFDGDFARGTIDAANYDVLPDGRFVMVQRSSPTSGPTLHVFVNWLAALDVLRR
jgi:Tol biopolymer transport system component